MNTPAVFGNDVDIFAIAHAVEDGAAVRIYYENRLAKVALSEEGKKLIQQLDKELEERDLKPMKGHNLMQAIVHVNRVHKDKTGGLVVDYLGIAADFKEFLSFYSGAGGKGDPTLAQEQAVEFMLEKLEMLAEELV